MNNESPETPTVETPTVETPTVETPTAETVVPEVKVETTETPKGGSFLDSLPENLRGHERLSGIESAEDLAQKFTDAQLAPVAPDADKYIVPEGAPKGLSEAANKHGLTQDQLNGVIEYFGGHQNATSEAFGTAMKEAAGKMVESWGEQAPENIATSRQALEYLHPDGHMKKLLDDTGYGDHPLVIEHFRKVGELFREGGYITSSVNTPGSNKTLAEKMFGNNHPSKEN